VLGIERLRVEFAYGANVLPVGLTQQCQWAASRAGAGVLGGGEEMRYSLFHTDFLTCKE